MSRPTLTDVAPTSLSISHDATATRFAARSRRSRWKGWRWRLGAGLAVLLVLAIVAGWLLFWGPLLVLRQVRVVAAPRASASLAQEVREAARLPSGRPLARLDLSAADRRVAAIPAVATVHISRSWPQSVTIRVTLRRPVAVVRDGAGVLHLADRSGVAYAVVTSAPSGLPLVAADAADPAAVQAVVHVLGALPASLRSHVTSAQANDPNAVVLKLGKITVSWGNQEDSARKALVLDALRRDNPSATRFDLSAPQSPSIG